MILVSYCGNIFRFILDYLQANVHMYNWIPYNLQGVRPYGIQQYSVRTVWYLLYMHVGQKMV